MLLKIQNAKAVPCCSTSVLRMMGYCSLLHLNICTLLWLVLYDQLAWSSMDESFVLCYDWLYMDFTYSRGFYGLLI